MKEMFDSIVLSGVRPCLPPFQSIMESDVHIRQKVYADIVLSNGASIFQEVCECFLRVVGFRDWCC